MRALHVLLAIVIALFACSATGQERRVFDLEISRRTVKGSGVVEGRPAGTLRVRRGDDVVLRWRTDEAVTLHLHGYNLGAGVSAGGTATLAFRARATGRFAVETHGIGTDPRLALTLLYIEVHPR